MAMDRTGKRRYYLLAAVLALGAYIALQTAASKAVKPWNDEAIS